MRSSSGSPATWKRSSATRCSAKRSPDRSARACRWLRRAGRALRGRSARCRRDHRSRPHALQSPNFYAFFPANASGPSILGDLLSSGFGVQGMLWATSPACTELETHVLDWLVDLLGLPEGFLSSTAGGGVIQDSASSSTLTALLAARERASAGATNEGGVGHGRAGAPGQRLTVYTSRPAHSSIEKGVKIAGLGRDNLRLVDADERYAMRVDALEAAIAADRAAGAVPAMVCATVGTTSSCAWIPCVPSARSAAARTSGFTSMPRTRAAPPSAPSTGASSTGWSWRTATPSTRTSGCSPTSIAVAFGLPTALR